MRVNMEKVLEFCEELKKKHGETISVDKWKREFCLHFGKHIYEANKWFKTLRIIGVLESDSVGRVRINV